MPRHPSLSHPIFGSAESLATRYPSDVSSLSCQANLEPVSASLQSGLRFFRHPSPAPPWAFLTVGLPSITIKTALPWFRAGATWRNTDGFSGEDSGFPRFALGDCATLGTRCRPGGILTMRPAPSRPDSYRRTFWSKPTSHLGLFAVTILSRVHMCLP